MDDQVNQIDIELRLFRILVEGSRELRHFIIKAVPVDAIVNIKKAWKLVLDKLSQNESASIDLLRLSAKLDPVQQGLVESIQNVRLYDDMSSVIDLAENILVGYQMHQLLSALRPHLKAVADGEVPARETLGPIMNTCQDLAVAFRQGESEAGIGEMRDPQAVCDLIFGEDEILCPLGFRGFDDECDGIGKGDLILVNATSGSGKTAFMLNCAVKMAGAGIPVCFYSLELSDSQIWKRIGSNMFNVDFKLLRSEKQRPDSLEEEVKAQIFKWDEQLRDKGSFIDVKGNPNLLISDIMADVSTAGYKVVFVDYLNLMNEGEGDQWQRFGDMARRLKLLAGNFGIAVILATQKDEDSGRVRYSRAVNEHCDIRLGWNIENREDHDIVHHYFPVLVEKGRNIPQFTFWLKSSFAQMRLEDTNPIDEIGRVERSVKVETELDEEDDEPLTLDDRKIEFW